MLSVHTLMRETQVAPQERKGKRVRKDLERRVLAEAMDSLPETPRVVLGLRYYESLSRRQIANMLSLDEDEVRELLVQAMRTVVERLEQEEQAEAEARPARRSRRPATGESKE